MLYKNVLSLFETESGLNFNLLEELLADSHTLLDTIADLKSDDLNNFLKLLIDQQQFKSFGLVVDHMDKNKFDYNSSLITLALLKMGKFSSIEDSKNLSYFLDKIDENGASVLLPFIEHFPEKVQKKIETSLMRRRGEVQEFKEDLKEQIEFLKTQMLTEKALEIEEKLKFHFPEIKEKFLSKEQSNSKAEEQRFAKIIDRNLSLNTSEDSNSTSQPSRLTQSAEEEKAVSSKLAKTWLKEMDVSNLDLLLTQLEFLNLNDPDFFSEVLTTAKDASVWTKAMLYLKSEQYLQGLNFLEEHETSLLTDSPESIYNYYYTKGLFLLGAGMNKEAEEIFTLIKEQKGNFRDIQSLLQNAK